MTDTSVTWLTQDAYDRLQAELERLSGPYRAEITERIAAARDEGDLKENGGYHAAREEQAKNEARIKELTEKLRTVQVGQPSDDGTVQPGMVVTVSIFGDDETFLLGSREMAGDTDMEVFSPTSPLGAAIVEKKVGDKTSYEAPNGKTNRGRDQGRKPFA